MLILFQLVLILTIVVKSKPPHTITIGGVEIPKPKISGIEEKKKSDSLNVKTMDAFIFVNGETVKEIWDV